MFVARYSKQFAELNQNIYIAPKTDNASEAPVPKLGSGGGTVMSLGAEAFPLNPPAMVTIEHKKLKPFLIVYRVGFPLSEMEIAAKKPEYFNYLVDAILQKALGNYKVTVGDEKKVRFGEYYCSYERPDKPNEPLRMLNDDVIELRLTGSWAMIS